MKTENLYDGMKEAKHIFCSCGKKIYLDYDNICSKCGREYK